MTNQQRRGDERNRYESKVELAVNPPNGANSGYEHVFSCRRPGHDVQRRVIEVGLEKKLANPELYQGNHTMTATRQGTTYIIHLSDETYASNEKGRKATFAILVVVGGGVFAGTYLSSSAAASGYVYTAGEMSMQANTIALAPDTQADLLGMALELGEGDYAGAAINGVFSAVPLVSGAGRYGDDLMGIGKGLDDAAPVVDDVVEGMGDLTSLYRAVGPDEFYEIMETSTFNVVPTGMQAKQFGLSFEETMKFAEKYSDIGAIIEVKVPSSMLDDLADYTHVDRFIFKDGTITIDADKLDGFNKIIQDISHKY